MLCVRRRFVVFVLDAVEDVRTAAPLIRSLALPVSGGGGSGGLLAGMIASSGPAGPAAPGAVGVGVMCTWSSQEVRALLRAEVRRFAAAALSGSLPCRRCDRRGL